MTEPFDPYALLGVERTATAEQIQRAYRRCAKRAHPDTNGGDGERMAQLNRARDILVDPQRRAQWDLNGSEQRQDPIEKKAQDYLITILRTVIRSTDPQANMIDIVTSAVQSQIQGCNDARQKCLREMAALAVRVQRLKGPPDNFIAAMLQAELAQATAHLPTYDADQAVMFESLKLLGQYRYGDAIFSSLLIGGQPHHLLLGAGPNA